MSTRAVPVRPPNSGQNLALAYLLLGSIGAFVGIVALAADQPYFRLGMAGGALTIFAFLLMLRAYHHSVWQHQTTVKQTPGGTLFAGAVTIRVWEMVIPLLLLIPFTMDVLSVAATGALAFDGSSRRTTTGLALLALAWWAMQLWALRLKPGLMLTPEGLRGVRGGKNVRLTWDELDHASAEHSYGGAKLMLYRTGGRPLGVDSFRMGSDPNVVAAVVEFYRLAPPLRDLLNDADAAMRKFREEARRQENSAG